MSESDRRSTDRTPSRARILWCVVGQEAVQLDRLRDISASGARIATESLPKVGTEIRFDVLDDDGERFATGLASVAWADPGRGMGITFLCLGVDVALLKVLASLPEGVPRTQGGPPPLPKQLIGPKAVPPPVPGASQGAQRDPFAKDGAGLDPLGAHASGLVIGIDLGTTNTCASFVEGGQPKILLGRTGTNTIPSVVSFGQDGASYVGQRAVDRQVLHPERTVYASKRLIGRTYSSDVAEELQQYFAYPLAEAAGHQFGIDLGTEVVGMEAIAARILQEVRASAEEHLGRAVTGAVITVPAYFAEVQREAVRRAAELANLVVHRLVAEPTAAAVAYGHKQPGKRARVAVWDFGGGTFDFSVVDVADEQLEVVVAGGDNFIGGADFDDTLASYLLSEFQRSNGMEFSPDAQQVARLREAAEGAKKALSAQSEHLVSLMEFTREPKRNLSVEVTQETFDNLARPLVEKMMHIASEVLSSGGLSPQDIDDVVLVGGATRIPAVQSAVAELFGRRPSRRINPDEAVAVGAALLAGEITTGQGATLVDILPMSVGYGVHGLRFVPIAKRHARLPTAAEAVFQADLLGTISVPLFQGESSDVRRNEYICSALVEDPSIADGKVRLQLSFDENCVMAVEATDARSGRQLPLELQRGRALDEVLADLGAQAPQADEPQPTTRAPTAAAAPPSRIGQLFRKLFRRK